MQNISTLSQLLQDSQCNYRIYDLGRRIQTIDSDLFEKVEHGQHPYPFPIQRKAQIAIAYWNDSQQPWIWFLSFNLDERGLMNLAEVGGFIKLVIEAMGSRLSNQLSDEQQEKLANNPFTFKPNEEKLAVFHSQIRAQLSLPASQYYEHAQHYFSGDLGWDNWQTVGLQGIADICARLKQQDNLRLVYTALNELPQQPLYVLLGVLEHTQVSERMAKKLYELAEDEMQKEQSDLFLISALVRSLASDQTEYLTKLLTTILDSALLSHQEVLIAIAGRCWSPLVNVDLAEIFLIRLAQTGNQSLFNQVFADLVMLPELRIVLLPMLHGTPSEDLARALVNLQNTTKG
jgi:hypothetical protein